MKSIRTATMSLVLLAVLGLAAIPAGAQDPAVNVSPGDAAKGKALFAAHQCWACHGHNGETETRLVMENGSFATQLQNVSGFITFLRAPRGNVPAPAGSSTSMPSYGKNPLPDQSAADLYAYIRSLKPTQPPLKDIPLLQQMSTEGGKLK